MSQKSSFAKRLNFPRLFKLSTPQHQMMFGYLIILPTLLIIFIFRFYPMLQAFYISMTDFDLIKTPVFVGFYNFIDLLKDPLFINSAKISATYVFFSVVPTWIISLGLAVLFNRHIHLKNFFRSAIFMPVIMPSVVMALVWTFMYHQQGVVNVILGWLQISPIPWLRSSSTALWAVILIGVWRASPYFMVIFLAGLQAIPEDYLDAAQIDGASPWQSFYHVTLPLLKPTTLLVVVMSIITAMKVFAVPLIMTGGGPANSTRVLPLFIYQTAFEFFDMGRASAMSIFLFAAVMLITIFQIRLFSSGEEE
ncbi:MAG TPA: sugar ABC transporter permease [Anaerolineaceae bacterium]|nr:sugar ABC transporter permease [Anaerolineaceae bacterium]